MEENPYEPPTMRAEQQSQNPVETFALAAFVFLVVVPLFILLLAYASVNPR